MSTKKKAKKKVAKKKDPNKSKAAQAQKKNAAKKAAPKRSQGDTVNSYCRELLLEKKYTDDDITSKVQKKYPTGKFKKQYVGCKRWDLNRDGAKPPIQRLVKVDGKVVPKTKAPKKTAASKKTKKKVAHKKK